MIKGGRGAPFVYRDSVWRGCDLIGTGVASFSHVNGVHFQNVSGWEPYLQGVESGEQPFERAFRPSADERLTREWVLQLKLGVVQPEYFRRKFGVDVLERFAPALERLQEKKMLAVDHGTIRLTRRGLLRVDGLLPEFYDPAYRDSRYT